jgi:Lrp/AsnC family transcriptional regulator for asnA, asnC and gidA
MMVKTSNTPGELPQLDSCDLGIFRELQRDGRTPFVAIADRLGVSEAYVRRRTARLIDAQVFSITAVADPKVFGIDCIAWLSIVAHPARAAAVATALVSLAEIDYVVQTAGEFNVMAEAACPTQEDLYRLLRRIRALPGVQLTETSVYLNLLSQQFQWALNGNSRAVRARRDLQLDSLDTEIVRQLHHDGRASFRTIAAHLGVSEKTVSARVARLTDQNALQVIAVGHPATLGFESMAWLCMHVREGADVESTAAALADVSGIDYVVVSAGRYDLMAELVCTDPAHLLDMLQHGVGRIREIVDVDSFAYMRLLYRSPVGAWGAARSLSTPATPRIARELEPNAGGAD